MTVPTNVVVVPSVAELPTCQKTLHGFAPPMRFTVLLGAVISVEPAWKMKTAAGSDWASNVTVPVSPSAESALYTPGASVCPPRSEDTNVGGVRPAASLYAVVRSACACSAGASAE